MDEKKLIIFTLGINSIFIYGTFVPMVSEVAVGNQSEDEKRILRESEGIAALMLLTLSGIAAFMAKSWLPLLMASAIAGGMFCVYEYAMAR